LPLTFKNESDYDKINQDDELSAPDILKELCEHKLITFLNKTKNGEKYMFNCDLTERQVKIIKEGGLLNETKVRSK